MHLIEHAKEHGRWRGGHILRALLYSPQACGPCNHAGAPHMRRPEWLARRRGEAVAAARQRAAAQLCLSDLRARPTSLARRPSTAMLRSDRGKSKPDKQTRVGKRERQRPTARLPPYFPYTL